MKLEKVIKRYIVIRHDKPNASHNRDLIDKFYEHDKLESAIKLFRDGIIYDNSEITSSDDWFFREDWVLDDLNSCGISECRNYSIMDITKDSDYELVDILKDELKQKVKSRIREMKLKKLLE